MMRSAWRRFLIGIAGIMLAGLLVGWLYDAPLTGLLAATFIVLFYQIRQLYRLDAAVANNRLDAVLFGEGVWSELAARINYLRERVRKNKRRYKRLFKEIRSSTNAMPDGAVILSAQREIVICNKAATRHVGINATKDRGQRIGNIIRDPLFLSYLDADPKGRKEAVLIPSPIVEDHWLSCRLVPFGGEQNLLLIRDMTESVRINEMRRDFVSNASHELRSPLTVISGYLDTLAEDDRIAEDWQKPLAQMRGQADRMNRIVAELLELSRLENPQAERQYEDVDVGALLALARHEWSGQPGVPKIFVDSTLTAKLRGVSTEIESVISNLLANAVRHTLADGRIELAWREGGDGGAVISVKDSGEGIEEEHLPRLTERFFRVDPGRSREAGGVGLGLAIVKHALLRHDASLKIVSKPGAGSTFSCHFPASRIVGATLVSLEAYSNNS